MRKGDLLLRIDPRDYLAAKAQADAQLLLARVQAQYQREHEVDRRATTRTA